MTTRGGSLWLETPVEVNEAKKYSIIYSFSFFHLNFLFHFFSLLSFNSFWTK